MLVAIRRLLVVGFTLLSLCGAARAQTPLTQAQIQTLINNNTPINWQVGLSGLALQQILTDLNQAAFTGAQRLGVFANDYGAACNGSGNDLTAFQNAINAAQTLGFPMRFTGSCAISGTLSVTSGLEIGGLYQSSSLNESNAASDIIDIDTASQVYIHDFTLGYSGFASSGTQAINVTAPASSENTQSLFEHLMIGGGSYIGINFVAASNWNINASHIDSQNVAVIVANTNNADSGDSTIYGSTLVGLGVSAGGGATAALEWNSSGGLRFSNNKINGITMTNGILIDLASGVTTSDILISNNSIEGVATNSVLMERQGSTGALSNVDIVGNQFVTNTNGINIPTDANGVWLTEVLIQGNTFALGLANPQVAFEVDTVQNINITSNAVLANGGGSNYAYKIGSTGPSSSNCVIGIVSKRGSFQASTGTSNCTVVGPD